MSKRILYWEGYLPQGTTISFPGYSDPYIWYKTVIYKTYKSGLSRIFVKDLKS